MKRLKTILYAIILVLLVSGLSMFFSGLWGEKNETPVDIGTLRIEKDMTLEQFGRTNKIPYHILKDLFGLKDQAQLNRSIRDYGDPGKVASMVTKKLALDSERASKNWIKIPVKFGLWIVFLTAVYIFSRRHRITGTVRKTLLFMSVMIFGVIMGSDPGPMGTVKDAIHLYGSTEAVFPPRMVALVVFLFMVFIANKYICAWGCQAGTLQDLVFRINRDEKAKALIGRQIKVPFIISNSVRVFFFVSFTVFAFLWGFDIINPIDPFKIFRPLHLGLAGGVFVGALLIASLFIYRPWCHLFCPFGLVGWLVEKVSLVKISVDYSTCIACNKCAIHCPSTVMSAILKQDTQTVPDCFACYTCREVCPTGSISFSLQKRTHPPEGFFKKKIE